MSSGPVLVTSGLTVRAAGTERPIVDDVTFSLQPGDVLGLVGESGSGKSTIALAIAQLLPRALTMSGSIEVEGRKLELASRSERRAMRGSRIGFVFQDPSASLDPLRRVSTQIIEAQIVHGVRAADARQRAYDLLADVGISNARERMRDFPHQMSGGMRQRVAIALALSCGPALLIADEPTTALDVTVQAQVLNILDNARQARNLAILLISHDIGVVSRLATHIGVLKEGRLVELGEAEAVTSSPRHPYSRSLVESAVKGSRPFKVLSCGASAGPARLRAQRTWGAP